MTKEEREAARAAAAERHAAEEAAAKAEFEAILQAAITAALEPLVQRVSALETALAGARTAYRDLRAKVEAAPAHAPRASKPNYWGLACKQLREERGLEANAWLPRVDIEQRMQELHAAG